MIRVAFLPNFSPIHLYGSEILFCALHDRQAGRILCLVCLPPRHIGMKWSFSSVAGNDPQYAHRCLKYFFAVLHSWYVSISFAEVSSILCSLLSLERYFDKPAVPLYLGCPLPVCAMREHSLQPENVPLCLTDS